MYINNFFCVPPLNMVTSDKQIHMYQSFISGSGAAEVETGEMEENSEDDSTSCKDASQISTDSTSSNGASEISTESATSHLKFQLNQQRPTTHFQVQVNHLRTLRRENQRTIEKKQEVNHITVAIVIQILRVGACFGAIG